MIVEDEITCNNGTYQCYKHENYCKFIFKYAKQVYSDVLS